VIKVSNDYRSQKKKVAKVSSHVINSMRAEITSLLTLKELLVSLAPELITLFQKLMNKYKLEEIKSLTMRAKTSNQILKVMTRFFKFQNG